MRKTLEYILKQYNLMPDGIKIIVWINWFDLMRIVNKLIKQDFDPTQLFGVLIPFGIWNICVFTLSTFALLVLFKQSYSLLKKLVYLQFVLLFVQTLDLLYIFSSLNVTKLIPRIILAIVYVGFFVFLNTYLLKQKKYFNKK